MQEKRLFVRQTGEGKFIRIEALPEGGGHRFLFRLCAIGGCEEPTFNGGVAFGQDFWIYSREDIVLRIPQAQERVIEIFERQRVASALLVGLPIVGIVRVYTDKKTSNCKRSVVSLAGVASIGLGGGIFVHWLQTRKSFSRTSERFVSVLFMFLNSDESDVTLHLDGDTSMGVETLWQLIDSLDRLAPL